MKVPPNPLVKHWIGVMRSKETPPTVFRAAMAELGRLLAYEAAGDGEWLPTREMTAMTPTDSEASVTVVDPTQAVLVVPILRAGLALAESVHSALPLTSTHHLGFARDEETLEPSRYLDALPERIDPSSPVLLVDPMLATGGTLEAALSLLQERGADIGNVRVLCAVASGPALRRLSQHSQLNIFAGMVDEEVDSNGFIIPGLGDAGDRAFGTAQ